MNDKNKALFQWNNERLEDVRFWCEPALTKEAVESVSTQGFPEFDGIATFEARGFYLAGIASAFLNLPVVLIRKQKPFFDKMAFAKVDFKNWKNENETLVILKGSMPHVKRVVVIDDIFDTGRSLKAGEDLLSSVGIEIVGAYYLLNAGSEKSISQFDFPVKSVERHQLL